MDECYKWRLICDIKVALPEGTSFMSPSWSSVLNISTHGAQVDHIELPVFKKNRNLSRQKLVPPVGVVFFHLHCFLIFLIFPLPALCIITFSTSPSTHLYLCLCNVIDFFKVCFWFSFTSNSKNSILKKENKKTSNSFTKCQNKIALYCFILNVW